MRGFIFTEFVEYIEREHGIELVDQLLESCDLPSGGAYTAVETYSSSEMVTLVQRLAEIMNVPVSELLQAYGRHLFTFLASSHASLLQGIDHPFKLFDVLEQHVHREVRKLYADAETPRFEVVGSGNGQMSLRYRSVRAMPDLAEGLIHGACSHFGHAAEVERTDQSGGQGTDVMFRIRLLEP